MHSEKRVPEPLNEADRMVNHLSFGCVHLPTQVPWQRVEALLAQDVKVNFRPTIRYPLSDVEPESTASMPGLNIKTKLRTDQ